VILKEPLLKMKDKQMYTNKKITLDVLGCSTFIFSILLHLFCKYAFSDFKSAISNFNPLIDK